MKKIASYVRKSLFLTLIPAFLALSGCTNDIDSASTVLGIDSSADDASVLNDNDGKSDKDTRKDYGSNDGSGSSVIDFGDNFIRGFDASAVDYYENNVDGKGAVTYKDTDGTTADFFVILAKHGYDTVRLRIWNDPSQQVEGSVPVGDNTLERTISMAKRIKAAGLKLMLDFHYSDTWTDPAKQYVPRAWLDAEGKDDIASRVSEYTTSVLQSLKDEAEIVPSYVQIGNEINSGMIRDKTTPSSTNPDFDYAGTGDTQAQYLESASEAVRAFDESIKIIVHVTSSNTPTNLLNRLKTSNLDYDIIGLSYYPWEEKHGAISAMISNVKSWKSTYGKDVIIAETSAQFDGDDKTVSKRNYSYQYMIDPDTSELYSDLTTETVSSTICVVGSVANAKAIVRHIMQETFEAGGIGCVAWGGEMHGDWDRAMFDWSGKAMDNIDAFNYKPADGYPTENSSDGNSSDNTGGGTDEGSFDSTTGAYVGDGTLIQIATATEISEKTFDYIVIDVTNMDWSAVSVDWNLGYATSSTATETTALSWISDTEYKIKISDASVIAAAKSEGLYLSGSSGVKGTVALTYGTNSSNVQTVSLTEKTITLAGWSYVNAYNSSDFSQYSIAKIEVKVTLPSDYTGNFCMYAGSAGNWLVNLSGSGTEYSATIDDESQIEKIKSGGLGFEADSTDSATINVVISYTTE
ncbi:MAG: glycosyl hydrolase 53 family protein [Treponema sp.]|nr:glycosyl hydrolase 53 family protein [Treponema sp.]